MDVRRAVSLAHELLAQHGLADWSVSVTRAKRQAGVCRDARKEIGLSGPLTRLHQEQEVRDTILHEIAHALVGPRHGHDAVWRAQALAIGCSGLRCTSPDAPAVPGSWVGACPAGHTAHRHQRPQRVMTCPRCAPRFDLAALFEWTYRGRPAPLHPNYVAELAALRAGTGPAPLPGGIRAGELVRITAGGAVHGAVGQVLKRGRTSYHVRVGTDVYRVLFAGVEPVAGVQ